MNCLFDRAARLFFVPTSCFALVCCSLLAVEGNDAFAQEVIYENDFDELAAGPYTDDDLDAGWDEPVFNDGVTEGRVSVVNGAEAFGGTGSALSIFFPADLAGTNATGAQWRFEFGESYEEAFLSYRVRFAPGFDFVRGGKLPGLAGGSAPTGSRQATGFNGWTGRLMWRTDFNGVSGEPQQLTTFGISYAKHTTSGFTQDGRQEDRTFFFNADGNRTEFVSDQWYQITQRIKMNTPGVFDGIQQIWVDGNLVLDESDLQFRLTDQFSIDQVYFSTFFGGNDDWRTSKDETIYFDDFVVSVVDDEPSDIVEEVPPPTDGPLLVPEIFPTLAAALEAASPGETITLSGELTESVVVRKSVRIEGTPGTVLGGENPEKAVIAISADGVELSGFGISGGLRGIQVFSDRENVLIEDMFISNAQSVGIFVSAGSNGLRILNSQSRDNGGDGIRVSKSADISVVDCVANDNGGRGYRIALCDDAVIAGNNALGNNSHGFQMRGERLDVSENQSLRNRLRGFAIEGGSGHVVFDNLARDNGSHGFGFDGSVGSSVIENRSRDNLSSGIRFSGGANGNLVDGGSVTGNASYGVQIGDSDGNEVIGLFVANNDRFALLIDSRSSGNFITENIFEGNGDPDRASILDRGDENVISDENTFR